MHPLGVALRRGRMRRILKRHPIPHRLWRSVTGSAPLLKGLDAVEMAHLREMAAWFLARKSITGAAGLEVTLAMRLLVAAQACLPILNLGVDYFAGWVEVILYPGAFRVSRERVDEMGVVHDETSDLSGESWWRGPVVLSWDDVERDSRDGRSGHNVVLHEFAHKLDSLAGVPNGMPPLRPGMSRRQWSEAFGEAFGALRVQLAAGRTSAMDAYAATSPAEFFAVSSEYFFAAPDILKHCCPRVHRQLRLFYGREAAR